MGKARGCGSGKREKREKREKLKVENIVVHKTLKRAQNENQHSADNCAGRSYPLNAMSFFITFMSFMVKLAVLSAFVPLCEKWSRNDGMVLHRGCPK